jgi:AbiV family abortive infection protein
MTGLARRAAAADMRAAGPGRSRPGRRRIGAGYCCPMDLRAVKGASRPELVACAAAAAENGQDLLDDAELLSDASRLARAYSLAVFAVEEFGKGVSLLTLAAMPENLRAQAPVRRMLECHQLKQVGGLLIAAVPFSEPGPAARLAAMPFSQLTQILDTMDAFVQDADRLKLRGMYVDMNRDAAIRRPTEITEADVSDQLGRARQVASSAAPLRDPDVQARCANPPNEAIELSRALVIAFAEAGDVCRPKAAAAVALTAVRKLQEHMAASGAQARSQSQHPSGEVRRLSGRRATAMPATPAGPRRPSARPC